MGHTHHIKRDWKRFEVRPKAGGYIVFDRVTSRPVGVGIYPDVGPAEKAADQLNSERSAS